MTTYNDIMNILRNLKVSNVKTTLSKTHIYININFGGYIVEFLERDKKDITLENYNDCVEEGYGENVAEIYQKHFDEDTFYYPGMIPQYNLWFASETVDSNPIDAVWDNEPVFATADMRKIDKLLNLILIGQSIETFDASNLDEDGGLLYVTFKNGFLLTIPTDLSGLQNNIAKASYNFSSSGITAFKEG